ncbi:helix-turn-helix domain-containing protein [Roseivirga echinicomitans]
MGLKVARIKPSIALSNIVQSFFTMEYDGDDERPDYLLPSGRSAFFYLESDHEFFAEFAGSDKKSLMKSGFYLAYLDNSAKYTHRKMRVVGVSLYPIYLSLVFKVKPKSIMNTFTRLDEIDAIESNSLSLGIDALETSSIIKRMEAYLLSKLNGNPLRKDVELVYQRIVATKAFTATVSEMASWMGFSERHVMSLFKDHIGLSPKRFIQLVRFSESLKRIDEMDESQMLADIAFGMGYHDQAHFTRDFKRLCGKTPKQIREDKKSGSYLMRQNLR